jgi:monothiol glutaredoxin
VSDLQDRIREIIETEPVTLFMKGTPDFIACGNSARALEALRAVGAPVAAVDVLPNPEIRAELSEISGWPTIPQVFIGGELVGGADITEELFQSGELTQKLEERLGEGWRAPGRERVIELEGGSAFRVV